MSAGQQVRESDEATERSTMENDDAEIPAGLRDDPFSYAIVKSGDVRVSRGGRVVTVVRGAAADRLAARLGSSDALDQQLLARVTGNYRRGNERRS